MKSTWNYIFFFILEFLKKGVSIEIHNFKIYYIYVLASAAKLGMNMHSVVLYSLVGLLTIVSLTHSPFPFSIYITVSHWTVSNIQPTNQSISTKLPRSFNIR